MLWNVFHHVDDGWQWECVNAAGEVQARRGGFNTHAESMADAVRHGYPGDLLPQTSQPTDD
jgi:hypothetical protein